MTTFPTKKFEVSRLYEKALAAQVELEKYQAICDKVEKLFHEMCQDVCENDEDEWTQTYMKQVENEYTYACSCVNAAQSRLEYAWYVWANQV